MHFGIGIRTTSYNILVIGLQFDIYVRHLALITVQNVHMCYMCPSLQPQHCSVGPQLSILICPGLIQPFGRALRLQDTCRHDVDKLKMIH